MTSESAKDPNEIEIRTKGTEAGYIVLPFNEEQFRSFINSLLGSPQTIGKAIDGPFEINRDDLRNLYDLILQRVTQQNSGTLARFSSKIVYSDNSFVELGTIDELRTYNIARPVCSTDVHLTWDFVIQFNNKQAPEKQSIQISFISNDKSNTTRGFDGYTPASGMGYISFRIEHTARTWGSDIDSLLSDYMETITRREPKIIDFVRKYFNIIFLVIFGLSGVIYGLYALVKSSMEDDRIKTQWINAIKSTDQITHKLDLLLEYMIQTRVIPPRTKDDAAVPIILAIAVFIILISFIYRNIGKILLPIRPSFVLLNSEAIKNRDKKIKKLQSWWTFSLISAIFSIIIGIVSNILSARLFLGT